MAYLALAYPELNKDDYDWIQNVRQAHDRYYGVVEPHFTIVFSTDKLSLKDFTDHVRAKLKNVLAFDVVLNLSRVVDDHFGNFFHTFLVPDQGYVEVDRLHDILYTGPLKSELREDIPFIPHMGIGTNETRQAMDKLAKSIDVQIKGRIETITIVDFDGQKVTNLETVRLRTD